MDAISRNDAGVGYCPLFVNWPRKVAELTPELYLHGLSEGDFSLVLWDLLDEDAPISVSTVACLTGK